MRVSRISSRRPSCDARVPWGGGQVVWRTARGFFVMRGKENGKEMHSLAFFEKGCVYGITCTVWRYGLA